MLGFFYRHLAQSYSPDERSWRPRPSAEATALVPAAFQVFHSQEPGSGLNKAPPAVPRTGRIRPDAWNEKPTRRLPLAMLLQCSVAMRYQGWLS